VTTDVYKAKKITAVYTSVMARNIIEADIAIFRMLIDG
jgi:hypothetical protein